MKLGNNNITDVKIGNTDINKVYIGNNLVWEKVTYSAEVLAIINEATNSGYTLPPSIVLTAMNTLIESLKTDGIWDKLDVFYNWAYNNGPTDLGNFCRLNYKTPTQYKGNYVGSTIFRNPLGLMGNTTNYFETNFNPGITISNYSQDNACRFFVIYQTASLGSAYDGTTGSFNNAFAISSPSTLIRINSSNSLSSSISTTGTGFKGVFRDDSSNVRVQIGNTVNNLTQNSTVLLNETQWVFKVLASMSNPGMSCYAMGSSLNNTEIANFRTAYNTYLLAIGLSAIA